MVTRVSAKAQFEYIAKELDSNIRNELYKRGVKVTNALRNAEIEVLSGTRSGKKYKGLQNTSSAPGEPPAVQSGDLRED